MTDKKKEAKPGSNKILYNKKQFIADANDGKAEWRFNKKAFKGKRHFRVSARHCKAIIYAL
jgi:hypothetical protein